jgi:hypothetical protein
LTTDSASKASGGARRRWRRARWLLIAVCAALFLGGAFAALRQGLIPPRWSPLPVVDLAEPHGWLIDWRLAELKADRDLCARVLRGPFIEALPIADKPLENGCGWVNAVRVTTLSGSKLSVDKLSCQAAAGLSLWLAHDVQPLAIKLFGQPVASIRHFGGYACRNVAGNPLFKHWRSAHATANAIDIAAFTLAGGRQIVVDKHWQSSGDEAIFLKSTLASACRYFHVAIGPGYNAAHKDHFHLDRGIGAACK